MKYRLLVLALVLVNFSVAQTIAKGKIVVERFLAGSVQGNLAGEDPIRRMTIYLPPGYEENKKRYPVIYYLHGFPIDDSICMAYYRFQEFLDKGIASGQLKPVIMVLPNSYTRVRGSLYTNSAFTGNWTDYIAKDVVQHVDKKFRTIPDRKSRGVVGNSMGGHGALKIGMMYSDVFSAVYSLCPGGLNWGPYFNIASEGFKKLQYAKNVDEILNGFDNLSADWVTNKDFYAMLFTVFGRAFATGEKDLPFYGAIPVQYIGDSMIVKPDILRRWEENFPYFMIDKYIASLKSLNALKLDWGRNDEIPFIAGNCLHFSKKLESYGIKHFAEEYIGDHDSQIGGDDGRINTEVLPFFNTFLKFEEVIPAKKK